MELLEVFDNKRIPLNRVVERYESVIGEYEQVTHLWIINDKGEFLMQKRSMNKKMFPGKWSVTGGAVDIGEKPIDGAIRECKEEIGVEADFNKIELMMSVKRTHVFVDVFLDRENFDVNDCILQKDEVDEVRWFSRDEVENLINEGKTANSIKKYFKLLCELIDE